MYWTRWIFALPLIALLAVTAVESGEKDKKEEPIPPRKIHPRYGFGTWGYGARGWRRRFRGLPSGRDPWRPRIWS